MKRPINLRFPQLTSLSSLEEMILINIRTLLSEMEHSRTIKQGVREAMMLSIITTSHCSRIQTTECSSGLLLLRYCRKLVTPYHIQQLFCFVVQNLGYTKEKRYRLMYRSMISTTLFLSVSCLALL